MLQNCQETRKCHILEQERRYLREQRLEKEADRLLRASVAAFGADEDYPFYSQYWLNRLTQHDACIVAEVLAHRPAPGPDEQRVALELLATLPMRRHWRQAAQLLVGGIALADAARLMHSSTGRVRRWARAAFRAVERNLQQLDERYAPDQAIRTAYREDTTNRGYIPEKHCRKGQEACRLTGLCARRWYLYLDDRPDAGRLSNNK